MATSAVCVNGVDKAPGQYQNGRRMAQQLQNVTVTAKAPFALK